jgi:hypothetical protein
MVGTEDAHLKIRINERVALVECGDLSPLYLKSTNGLINHAI